MNKVNYEALSASDRVFNLSQLTLNEDLAVAGRLRLFEMIGLTRALSTGEHRDPGNTPPRRIFKAF